LGGKWEEVKRCFSFTFHWPPSFGSTFTPPHFSFFLKGKFESLTTLFFSGHNFQFNLEKTCSYERLEEEKNDQPW
jgi:hypothetical protein